MTMRTRDIEILKHRASFANSVGNSVMAGSIVAPIVAYITGNFSSDANIGVISLLAAGGLWLGFALHELGEKNLKEIST